MEIRPFLWFYGRAEVYITFKCIVQIRKFSMNNFTVTKRILFNLKVLLICKIIVQKPILYKRNLIHTYIVFRVSLIYRHIKL